MHEWYLSDSFSCKLIGSFLGKYENVVTVETVHERLVFLVDSVSRVPAIFFYPT